MGVSHESKLTNCGPLRCGRVREERRESRLSERRMYTTEMYALLFTIKRVMKKWQCCRL